MRYIPSSRYTLDEIAEQCRQAVLAASRDTQSLTVSYDEVRKFYHYSNPLLVAQ
jgi:ABC-type sulfate transport system substrate-binding protein